MAARGYPMPLGFRWKRDADNLTNMVIAQTNSSLTIPSVSLTNSGAYQVIVTNSAYTTPFAVSALAFLTVVTPPQNQSVEAGGNVSFSVSARAGNRTSNLRYQWQFNGNNLANATNTTLNLTNLSVAQHGTYTVMVTNPAGVATGFSAGLTVIPPAGADTDGDGMPDWWEQAHNLQPLDASDASEDADHDGATNLQEYQAGTDPNDAQSYLRFEGIYSTGNDCRLEFFAVSNKTYSVLYLDVFPPATWQKLADTLAAPSNRVERLTDTNANSSFRFYRLVTPTQE